MASQPDSSDQFEWTVNLLGELIASLGKLGKLYKEKDTERTKLVRLSRVFN